MMKYICIILFLITGSIYSQQINGVYKSNFTMFRSQENPEKNFTNDIDAVIIVEIYDAPYTRGYASLTTKSSSGESVTIKFIVKKDKTYKYEDGETFICYDGLVSLLDVETKKKCTIAFDVKVQSLIISFEGGGTQLWDLKRI
jgi:hypothetical protein